MSLNIKSERVHELAREAARLTGLSQTGAVEEALRRLLAEHEGDTAAADRARRLDVLRSISLAWDPAATGNAAIEDVDDLYDPETGPPA